MHGTQQFVFNENCYTVIAYLGSMEISLKRYAV